MPEVLLIGGMARSGTTLVRNLLGGHPDVQAVPTECLGFGHFGDLPRLTGIRSPSNHQQMEEVLKRALARTRLREWGVDLDTAIKFVPEAPRGWPGLFIVMLEAFHKKHPSRAIAAKTVAAEKHYLELKDLLDQRGWHSRLIYAVRHPLETYRSFRYRRQAWRQHLQWTMHTDTLAWCGRWLDSTSYALDLRAVLPETMRLAMFEQITADPSEACREWCRWLGLPDHSGDMVELSGQRVNSSFGTRGVATSEGGVLDVSTRTPAELTTAEVELVLASCGARARALGFDTGNLPAPAPLPAYFEQHLSMSLLPASDYLIFQLRDLRRRIKRFALTHYSRLTKRSTSIQLR